MGWLVYEIGSDPLVDTCLELALRATGCDTMNYVVTTLDETQRITDGRYVRRIGNELTSDPKRFWKFVDDKRKCKGVPVRMTLGA